MIERAVPGPAVSIFSGASCVHTHAPVIIISARGSLSKVLITRHGPVAYVWPPFNKFRLGNGTPVENLGRLAIFDG